MRLMFDRLRLQMRNTPLNDLLSNTTVFYNDDALRQAINGEVELEELPSLAPPYDKFFVEFRMPLFDEARERYHILAMPYAGVHITALRYPEGVMAKFAGDLYEWSYEMIAFLENQNTGEIDNLGAGYVLLDTNGQALEFTTEAGETGYCRFTWGIKYRDPKTGAPPSRDRDILPQTILDAALYTVGMLHCRNIGTTIVDPRRAEAKKMLKHYGVPMTRYHILKVTGKGSGAGAEIGAPTGQHRPLHWCRGHFKHYTEEAPLMGKFSGTYYFGAHVRGRASAGAVVKDYEVGVQP